MDDGNGGGPAAEDGRCRRRDGGCDAGVLADGQRIRTLGVDEDDERGVESFRQRGGALNERVPGRSGAAASGRGEGGGNDPPAPDPTGSGGNAFVRTAKPDRFNGAVSEQSLQ